jgi:uncharacterized protein (DUF58 family)
MKLRIWYFLIPLAIGIIASATGFSLMWRLFIISLLVPLIGYLWTFTNIRNIDFKINQLPAQSRLGDVLDNPLTLTNTGRIPKVLVKVQELSDLPGYHNTTVTSLGPHSSLVLRSHVSCSQRGRYSLGSYVMSTYDPLGLFYRARRFGNPQSILVFPKIIDLPFFDPLAAVSNRYGTGKWLSSEISPNVASIRQYVSGDSLKHIHWKTTAHSSTLMV